MEPAAQSAQGSGIAQAYGHGAMASVTIVGITPEELQQALRAAGGAQQAVISDLSRQLDTTREAVRGFFNILSASEVPVEKLPRMLEEIAQRHRAMLQRLGALDRYSRDQRLHRGGPSDSEHCGDIRGLRSCRHVAGRGGSVGHAGNSGG